MPSFTTNSLGVSANYHYIAQGRRAERQGGSKGRQEARKAGTEAFPFCLALLPSNLPALTSCLPTLLRSCLGCSRLRRRVRCSVPAMSAQRIVEPRRQADAVARGQVPLDVRRAPHAWNRRADGRVLEDEAQRELGQIHAVGDERHRAIDAGE